MYIYFSVINKSFKFMQPKGRALNCNNHPGYMVVEFQNIYHALKKCTLHERTVIQRIILSISITVVKHEGSIMKSN